MFEKVNPSHPDKVADRIAGALVDMAYSKQERPKVAVEVLIGHGTCHLIIESSYEFTEDEVQPIVDRIDGKHNVLDLKVVPQAVLLARNQSDKIRCGDNGIFKGTLITKEQNYLSEIARHIYKEYASDGKYLIGSKKLTICQSNAMSADLKAEYPEAIVNPLGDWTGGTDVDTGATNRKLGSDMGDGVTGGGLHGKDLSKADVSVNIYAFLKAQKTGRTIELHCSIGDTEIDGLPYSKIVNIAKNFIKEKGGFEKFAKWGLV